MIPHHCAYFCCCTCFGIKNINVTTRFYQILRLFRKILSIIRIVAVAIIHFISGLTHALLVVTFTITPRTGTSIPIQNRKNLSFPVTAKLFTLSAIESEQPNAYRRIWNHSDAYAAAQYPSAQLICATTFSVSNRILERPTKLSKNNPHSLRFLEDIGGLSWLCRADEILGSVADEAEAL